MAGARLTTQLYLTQYQVANREVAAMSAPSRARSAASWRPIPTVNLPVLLVNLMLQKEVAMKISVLDLYTCECRSITAS